jgi:xylose isomerase
MSKQHTYKHEIHYGTGKHMVVAISGCSGDHKAGWHTTENIN